MVTAFNSHLMHFFDKMVLDSELIVGSKSYEQKLQLLLLLTQWCGGNAFVILCFRPLASSLVCRMFYTGDPCIEGTAQEVILFIYFEWLCGCESD